jgi:hypothetical protein
LFFETKIKSPEEQPKKPDKEQTKQSQGMYAYYSQTQEYANKGGSKWQM